MNRPAGKRPDGRRAGIAIVALGANLGERAGMLTRVLSAFRDGELSQTELLSSSQLLENPALDPAQPPFFNAVAALDTDLDPHAMLEQLLELEVRLGRIRRERRGPRTIDLDLVAWVPRGATRSSEIDDGRLVLPHPEAHRRAFVLGPLAELWPQLELAGRTVAAHLAALPR